jgi:hypothetical protein
MSKCLGGGTRWTATVFTVALLDRFERYRSTGECADGLYIWASDMIVAREITAETVEATVSDLIATGEFDFAFSELRWTANADKESPRPLCAADHALRKWRNAAGRVEPKRDRLAQGALDE